MIRQTKSAVSSKDRNSVGVGVFGESATQGSRLTATLGFIA